MKKLLRLMLVIFLLNMGSVLAEEPLTGQDAWDSGQFQRLLEEQAGAAELSELKNAASRTIPDQTAELFPDLNVESITKNLATGSTKWNPATFINRIARFFMQEVYVNIKVMLQLIVLTIICGLLTNLQGSFGKEGVGEVAFFACYIYMIGVMIKSFTYAISLGKEVIDNMVLFMQAMVPTLMTLLISTGNITSASLFQPAVLFAVQFIGATIKNFLIPLLFMVTALTMVNSVSDKFHITRLIAFLKQVSKWSLGILLTGFIGVITVQGLTTSVIDGVGTKTAKFAVGNFIPVVGGILSDAVDTVISCSLILKNAVGVTGLIIILFICLIPILKIVALISIYKLTAAVIEPISDRRIVQSIEDLSNSLTHLFAMVVSVAVMLMISITIVIGAGNISAMFR